MLAASFPMLIHELCRTYHGGIMNAMKKDLARAGYTASYSSLSRWERGEVAYYRPAAVEELIRRYALDPAEVWALIRQDTLTRASGGLVPIPDLTGLKPGPAPRHQQKRRGKVLPAAQRTRAPEPERRPVPVAAASRPRPGRGARRYTPLVQAVVDGILLGTEVNNFRHLPVDGMRLIGSRRRRARRRRPLHHHFSSPRRHTPSVARAA